MGGSGGPSPLLGSGRKCQRRGEKKPQNLEDAQPIKSLSTQVLSKPSLSSWDLSSFPLPVGVNSTLDACITNLAHLLLLFSIWGLPPARHALWTFPLPRGWEEGQFLPLQALPGKGSPRHRSHGQVL